MKTKKIVTSILLMMMLLAQFSFVSAISDAGTMEVTLVASENANLSELNPGTEFSVIAHIDNFSSNVNGINAMLVQLEYNKDILQYKGIEGLNGWETSFNETSGKFVAETKNNNVVTTPIDAFKINFKVNESIKADTTTAISLKGIQASGGNGLVRANDVVLSVGIKMPVEPDLPESITSTKYEIANGMVAKIIPGTTVKEFMKNVTLKNVENNTVTFTDKTGKILGENDVIATGMTVKVGETLQFTASVLGDVDGDGQITVNDLAKVKLHYIEDTSLTGVYLKAADVDGKMEDNKPVGVNDIARIKLVLINLFEIK